MDLFKGHPLVAKNHTSQIPPADWLRIPSAVVGVCLSRVGGTKGLLRAEDINLEA